jgi:hypothetical protein
MAQPYFDVFNMQYINSPGKGLSENYPKNSEVQYTYMQLNVPVKMHDDVLLLNPFYESYKFAFQSSPTLKSVALPVAFLKQWKKPSWKTAFVFIPRVNSDFVKITAKDYQYGIALLGFYKKKRNLTYKFGVYYNSEFFGPFIIPLLGIDWRINSRIYLFGVLPGYITYDYSISSLLHAGMNFRSITNSYRFNGNPYVKVADNYLKLFLDFYIAKNFVITAEVGHTVFRKYSVHGSDEPAVDQLKDALLLKAGITYRVFLPEEK